MTCGEAGSAHKETQHKTSNKSVSINQVINKYCLSMHFLEMNTFLQI
jgi:hypothetical protein